MRKIILLLSCVAFISLLSGCALNEPKGKDIDIPSTGKIQIPEDTAVIKFVKKDGKTETFLANGKRFKPCKFCPEGRTEECAKSKTVNYCKGNINATLNSVETTVLIKSSVNPICWTEIVNGKPRQRCVCYPGETNPLCN